MTVLTNKNGNFLWFHLLHIKCLAISSGGEMRRKKSYQFMDMAATNSMAPPSLPTQVYVAINREQEVRESVRKDFIQSVLLPQLQLLVG